MPKKQWQTRRKRGPSGGAFIRKGSYGCAFATPPLKCKGESARRPANQLSKLLEYDKAREEFRESVPFQRIDPEKRYFLWASHICPLDTKDVVPENRINKCIRKNSNRYPPTVNMRKDPTLIFYDLGGKDISDIVITSGQYGPFFLSFGNLLKGLSFMHANRIVHLDIKPLNLVSMELPSGMFSSRFIDFGLSASTAKGTSSNQRILDLSTQDYSWWPFDFRFLSRETPNMTSTELRIWYEKLQTLQSFYPQSSYWREDWTPKYNFTFVQELMSQVPWEYREHILQELDVYALGVSFAEVYALKTNHFMRTSGGKDTIGVRLASKRVIPVSELKASDVGGDPALVIWHKSLAEKVSMPLFTLIKQMIYIDPMKRITAEKASVYFNANLVDPIVDFFTKMDRFTSRALNAVGISVENTPIRIRASPAPTAQPLSTALPALTAPTAPPAYTAPTAPPLPTNKPSYNVKEVLRQAQEIIGINEPTSVAKTTSTAGSDPAMSGPTFSEYKPAAELKVRTFAKKPAQVPQPWQPWQPVVQPNPVPLPKPLTENRRGIAGVQRTGVNVLRKLPLPDVPQNVAKPYFNKTRKHKFWWEK